MAKILPGSTEERTQILHQRRNLNQYCAGQVGRDGELPKPRRRSRALQKGLVLFDLPSPAATRRQLWAKSTALMGDSKISDTLRSLLIRNPTDGIVAYSKAFDALTTAHMGATYKQPDLAQQARLLYHEALQHMNQDLALAVRRRNFSDQVLATPYLLFLATLFTSIAGQEGSFSCLAHLRGFASILRSIEQKPTAFYLLLIDSCIQPLWILELCMRKALPICISHEERSGLSELNERYPDLTCDVSQLPLLLERFDKLNVDNSAARKRFENDIARLEARIEWWLQSQRWAAEEEPFTELPVHTLPCFTAHLDDLSMQLFETGYGWVSVSAAWAHCCAWITLLSLIILRMHLIGNTDLSPDGFRRTGDELAGRLSRTIIWFVGSPSHGTEPIVTAAAVIPFVTRWYTSVDDPDRMQWCRAMRRFIEEAGITTLSDLRVPGVRAPLNA